MTREEAKQLILNKAKQDKLDRYGQTIHLLSLYGIIEKIFDDFDNKTCKDCKHIGIGQCLLKIEVETISGLCETAYMEIDNPDMYYCYDYEPKDEE